MRAARLRFGNTLNRDCILITGKWAGKQMDAAIAAEGQLPEMWMFLASAGVQPMSEAPTPRAVTAHDPATLLSLVNPSLGVRELKQRTEH